MFYLAQLLALIECRDKLIAMFIERIVMIAVGKLSEQAIQLDLHPWLCESLACHSSRTQSVSHTIACSPTPSFFVVSFKDSPTHSAIC